MSIAHTTTTAASAPRGLSPLVLPARGNGWPAAPAYRGSFGGGFSGGFMATVCPQLVVDNDVRFVGKQPHQPRGVPR